MLYGILATLFCFVCLFIILLVMVQKSQGGFGHLGGSPSESSSVFGGSGGADILQKITWICIFLILIITFTLSVYRAKISKQGKYYSESVSKKIENDEKISSEDLAVEEQEISDKNRAE